MTDLTDLEHHFPPEKVEAIYAALNESLGGPHVQTRAIVGAFCAELRRHGYVVTATSGYQSSETTGALMAYGVLSRDPDKRGGGPR